MSRPWSAPMTTAGSRSIILEVRAGTGGDEATLWARDLIDMYTKYAARRGWKIEALELTPKPASAVCVSVTLAISGRRRGGAT